MSFELEDHSMEEQFERLIESNDTVGMRDFLNEQNISDVASLIDEYPDYEAQIIGNMAIHRAASVF